MTAAHFFFFLNTFCLGSAGTYLCGGGGTGFLHVALELVVGLARGADPEQEHLPEREPRPRRGEHRLARLARQLPAAHQAREPRGEPPVDESGEARERPLVGSDEQAERLRRRLIDRIQRQGKESEIHQRLSSSLGVALGRSMWAIRSSTPLTNAEDSSEPNFFPSSIASLSVTRMGTSARRRISYTASRRMLRSTRAIRSSFQCVLLVWMSASICGFSDCTPRTSSSANRPVASSASSKCARTPRSASRGSPPLRSSW